MWISELYRLTFAIITLALALTAIVALCNQRRTAHFLVTSAGVAALLFTLSYDPNLSMGTVALLTAGAGVATARK